MVCIVASAFFTTLTGGSGVTIVAIGGLLYPALRKQGYPDSYALGLVTTGGSLGLLLPPSLPILVYALVAGIDFNAAFKAGIIPGVIDHGAARRPRRVHRAQVQGAALAAPTSARWAPRCGCSSGSSACRW